MTTTKTYPQLRERKKNIFNNLNDQANNNKLKSILKQLLLPIMYKKLVLNIYQAVLITLIVQTNSPLTIVESKSFRQLLQSCNSQCPNIFRWTAITNLRKLHDKLQTKTNVAIQKYVNTECRVNFTGDTWTANNKLPYLGITVYVGLSIWFT